MNHLLDGGTRCKRDTRAVFEMAIKQDTRHRTTCDANSYEIDSTDRMWMPASNTPRAAAASLLFSALIIIPHLGTVTGNIVRADW